MGINMLVVGKDPGAIVKEFSTNKFVDVKYLEDYVHQVDNFTEEEFCRILVVSPLVFCIDQI